MSVANRQCSRPPLFSFSIAIRLSPILSLRKVCLIGILDQFFSARPRGKFLLFFFCPSFFFSRRMHIIPRKIAVPPAWAPHSHDLFSSFLLFLAFGFVSRSGACPPGDFPFHPQPESPSPVFVFFFGLFFFFFFFSSLLILHIRLNPLSC